MPPDPQKIQALRRSGTLNANPQKVRQSAFIEGGFFDPHDLVQLKYETLRAVENDGKPIVEAALEFGLSRPTIYECQENFRQDGMEGLLPKKRGPKQPRKLTGEVCKYMSEALLHDPGLKMTALAESIKKRFGIVVHPRTLEKAVVKKGLRSP